MDDYEALVERIREAENALETAATSAGAEDGDIAAALEAAQASAKLARETADCRREIERGLA